MSWRTLLIGFGQVAAGYAQDPLMARYYPFASHAQVLAAHPDFNWVGVVDPAESARASALEAWSVPWAGASLQDLPPELAPQVAVIATPPDQRLELLEQLASLPGLKALLVEKPLGASLSQARAFVERAEQLGLLVQVNYWRRADTGFRALAAGLEQAIGTFQTGRLIYGNGLHNNGIHLIDFARMLLGEISAVQAIGQAVPNTRTAWPGDINLAFGLQLASGQTLLGAPLDFSHYRENGLDLWGREARIEIGVEGLVIQRIPASPHRATSGEGELSLDQPERLESTVGEAFYAMYSQLNLALQQQAPLCSPARSALRNELLVAALLESLADCGRLVSV